MAASSHLRWELHDYEPNHEPDIVENEEARPRDAVVDQAKNSIRRFFEEEPASVFYKQQLQVLFETGIPNAQSEAERLHPGYFHWVTSRALAELVAEGAIAVEREELPGVGHITFFRSTRHRYVRRQVQGVIELVSEFSAPAFTAGLGAQGELMFAEALATVGFVPGARNVKTYGGREWRETEHDLDRVFEREGIAYGAEIKNTLKYIPHDELQLKMRMCEHLRLRPLFIVRAAAKSYIEEVRLAGGFTLVFKFQLYPFGQKPFANRVRAALRLPVDSPTRIADGTVQRFLTWHERRLAASRRRQGQ